MARALWLIDETKGPIDSDNHVVSLLSSSRWVSRARCQTVACCFCLFAFLCCVVSDTMADGCEPDVCVQMQKVCSDCFWHAYVRRCLRSFVSFFRHSAIRLRQTLLSPIRWLTAVNQMSVCRCKRFVPIVFGTPTCVAACVRSYPFPCTVRFA